jgi:hypothetical protein
LESYIIIASLSLALLFAVTAFIREARLRRALQTLLRRLLMCWRRNETKSTNDSRDRDDVARRM